MSEAVDRVAENMEVETDTSPIVPDTAEAISYDNNDSELEAGTVQEAIDALAGVAPQTASDIVFDPGESTLESTDVAAALLELATRLAILEDA